MHNALLVLGLTKHFNEWKKKPEGEPGLVTCQSHVTCLSSSHKVLAAEVLRTLWNTPRWKHSLHFMNGTENTGCCKLAPFCFKTKWWLPVVFFFVFFHHWKVSPLLPVPCIHSLATLGRKNEGHQVTRKISYDVLIHRSAVPLWSPLKHLIFCNLAPSIPCCASVCNQINHRKHQWGGKPWFSSSESGHLRGAKITAEIQEQAHS